MVTNGKPPHFVLFPFMAQGHLILAVDIAKLLEKRGVDVSILVTPKNSNRVKKAVERAIDSGLSIRVFHLRLPCAKAGLPKGCEFFDKLPSMHYLVNFFKVAMLQEQVEEYLLQLNPTCLIADLCFPWATNMAMQLRIPSLVFHGTSCFAQVCMGVLHNSKFLEGVATDTEYFVMPDFPDKIEINKVQLTGFVEELSQEWPEIRKQLNNSEDNSAGTVANTFEELKMEYVSKYGNLKGKKVWCKGSVSLCNVEDADKAERGNTEEIGGHDDCLKWLDAHGAKSVVYVYLETLSRVVDAQQIEMGLGVEASKRPFVWVISIKDKS